jgi:hypothetical protein
MCHLPQERTTSCDLTVTHVHPPSNAEGLIADPEGWMVTVSCPQHKFKAKGQLAQLNPAKLAARVYTAYAPVHPALIAGDYLLLKGARPDLPPLERAGMCLQRTRRVRMRLLDPDWASVPRLRARGATNTGLMFRCLDGYQVAASILGEEEFETVLQANPIRAFRAGLMAVSQAVIGHISAVLAITNDLRSNKRFAWAADLADKLANISYSLYGGRDTREVLRQQATDFSTPWAMLTVACAARGILEAGGLQTPDGNKHLEWIRDRLHTFRAAPRGLATTWAEATQRRLGFVTVPVFIQPMVGWAESLLKSLHIRDQEAASRVVFAIELAQQAARALEMAGLPGIS